MIDRRGFLNSIGAAAAVSALPSVSNAAESLITSTRLRIPLSGDWELLIGGVPCGIVNVPSSRRPSGYYTLQRSVTLPKLSLHQRVVIHFEGVCYWGSVAINGTTLGKMGPYVPYEFDCTAVASEGSNLIQVQIADLTPLPDGTASAEIALGVNPGWEAYGGIVRDVWLEIRPASFIQNVRLAYDFTADYRICYGQPKIIVSSSIASAAQIDFRLKLGAINVAQITKSVMLNAGSNELDLAFELKDPALWSPGFPNLYELTASVSTSATHDNWICQTGFREVKTNGREFRLNGKRLVLNGVCRHDMWKDEGFTLSSRQQEQDMRMIKGLGCNFVRLVHYPHDRHIIELADQLGLLVSEEPGFWQMDFSKIERARIELGFGLLEATIRRDWNSPSVMIWFLSNECTLTEEFLREGKRRCNQMDPLRRLVSAANDKSAKDVKPLFISSGMDFFDQHENTFDMDDFAKEAEFDGPTKPLTFSEWGGKSVGQSEPIMRQSVDRLIDLVEARELSGHMFWSWQDLRQYSRIDGEMNDGVLESGVVTEAREPRTIVAAELMRLFERRRSVRELSEAVVLEPNKVPLKWIPFSPSAEFWQVDLQAIAEISDCRTSWANFEATMATYWADSSVNDQWKRTGSKCTFWRRSETRIAGVAFRSPVIEGSVRPIVLTSESPEISIPIQQSSVNLHILGQVTFPGGFPITGTRGETVAVYTLEFENGMTRSIPIRNGIEVARSNCIHQATRIEPIATAAQPALEFIRDVVREQYQILLFSIPTEDKKISGLRCKLLPHASPPGDFCHHSGARSRLTSCQ